MFNVHLRDLMRERLAQNAISKQYESRLEEMHAHVNALLFITNYMKARGHL